MESIHWVRHGKSSSAYVLRSSATIVIASLFLNSLRGRRQDNAGKWRRDADVLLRSPLEGASYFQIASGNPVRRTESARQQY